MHICPYEVKRQFTHKSLHVNCRCCSTGASSIDDPQCRSNLFAMLSRERGVDQLILDHTIVKVYAGPELEVLKQLTTFIERADAFGTDGSLPAPLSAAFATVAEDPIYAYQTLSQHVEDASGQDGRLVHLLGDLRSHLTPSLVVASQGNVYSTLRPYVRPGFIDSFIRLEPPQDAAFLESYEVLRPGGRPIHITLYQLRSRPEKLYFAVPPEFTLPRQELQVLEEVRSALADHRPTDTTFLDSQHAEEYFKHLAVKTMVGLCEGREASLATERIEYLADVFARYSAGLGILEDLLLDQRIQDIYINAPAVHNPLHLVVDGEEYTSNIVLSEGDIEALASKFRTVSARAFSEASPILDMDLAQYHTRIAAISNPLTPRGIAFALRHHRPKPWTLAHFVANRMLPASGAGLLSFLVDGQATMLLAGSRGAGKTSLLSALLLEIPQRFRILTIEDTAEIPVHDLQRHGYKLQSLLTRSISTHSSTMEIDPTDALRTALRLGESVLVLGEVRGLEAKVLFEAMRVGAAGNLIMGTIHGSTTQDVYERVVYDIGVPSTSFKAVDAVVIAAPIRHEGGVDRRRRVIQISETCKDAWSGDPNPAALFTDLMAYDASRDELVPTSLLDRGQSQVVGGIARKWGMSIEKALQNIALRTEVKRAMAAAGQCKPAVLEAASVCDANNMLWLCIEEGRRHGPLDYDAVWRQWSSWFAPYVRSLS